MTRSNRMSSLVVAGAAVAMLAGGIAPAAEANDPGSNRRQVVVAGAYRGGYRSHYGAGGRWRGYYGPYGPYGPDYHRLGWGFGFYDPFWDPYYYEPPGGIDMNVAVQEGLGAIDVDVKPNRAEVWVDGKYVAQARDLDGNPSYLWLPDGVHHVVIYQKGYSRFEQDVDVRRGIRKPLEVRLTEGESEPPAPSPAH
jgi:PEGA domain